MKKVTIRIADVMCKHIIDDLSRGHKFAYERVGFVMGYSKELNDGNEIIIISEYVQVADEHYIEDDKVGARINGDAIRNAMQIAMDRKCSIFHIHYHLGFGTPKFSRVDLKELPNIASAMVNANPENTHGIILINDEGANAIVKCKSARGKVKLEKISRVGFPIVFNENWFKGTLFDEERYDRQSFLGESSQCLLSKVKVGIIGLGGGGSHIIQQLAHLGIKNYVIFDYDNVENSNLNRLVGGTVRDVESVSRKTEIALRQISGLQPNAKVITVNKMWQEDADLLQFCDVVFGAVDSFAARRDLEQECRRYLIPLIDIGMDVCIIEPEPPRLFGQVILSMPGKPCMHCIGYLTADLLASEARKYGDAGNKPQVIWSNGVLASNAVGIFVDLITGWSKRKELNYFQEYDGNNITLVKSYRLNFLNNENCTHYPLKDSGPIRWGGR